MTGQGGRGVEVSTLLALMTAAERSLERDDFYLLLYADGSGAIENLIGDESLFKFDCFSELCAWLEAPRVVIRRDAIAKAAEG